MTTETQQDTITIYTGANCVRCEQTKRLLDQAQLPYELVDVHSNESAIEHMRELGYSSLPVVFAPAVAKLGHWSGFDMLKIRNLIKTLTNTPTHAA